MSGHPACSLALSLAPALGLLAEPCKLAAVLGLLGLYKPAVVLV